MHKIFLYQYINFHTDISYSVLSGKRKQIFTKTQKIELTTKCVNKKNTAVYTYNIQYLESTSVVSILCFIFPKQQLLLHFTNKLFTETQSFHRHTKALHNCTNKMKSQKQVRKIRLSYISSSHRCFSNCMVCTI